MIKSNTYKGKLEKETYYKNLIKRLEQNKNTWEISSTANEAMYAKGTMYGNKAEIILNDHYEKDKYRFGIYINGKDLGDIVGSNTNDLLEKYFGGKVCGK